jgi:hypothetical protein
MLRIVNNPPIIRVRLKYPDVLSFTYRYAHRLTSKGLFLVVKTPSLPGAQVRFELLLEGGDVVFAGLGEITWIKPFPDSKGFYGMIIRFITLDEGCQEILQLALSQKDASRKDAFDHQKIAEDPLPDDQIDTTPFISKRNTAPPEPTTNRYYSLQANPALAPQVGFDSSDNLGENWAPAENQSKAFDEEKPSAKVAPEDDFEEDPTEDTMERRTKRGPSLRSSTAAVPDHAPTHRNPSLVLIEGIAAQQLGPRFEDVSDITTGENLGFDKPKPTFNKIIFGDDDVPTDTSTKQFILPKIEGKAEEPPDEEDASLEFISKRPEVSATQQGSGVAAFSYGEGQADSTRTPSKAISGSPRSLSKPISERPNLENAPWPIEAPRAPSRPISGNALPPLDRAVEIPLQRSSKASSSDNLPSALSIIEAESQSGSLGPIERGEELEATDLASGNAGALLPKEENSSARNLGFATTDEISIFPKAKESIDEALPVPVKEFKSKTETKKTRPITQNDPPTNIRILIAKPIPIIASEQDAEMERLAHEAGLADLDALVGWSRELIKGLPKTPAHIERELMALAIASKKLY